MAGPAISLIFLMLLGLGLFQKHDMENEKKLSRRVDPKRSSAFHQFEYLFDISFGGEGCLRGLEGDAL